jgi:hypothetical protein
MFEVVEYFAQVVFRSTKRTDEERVVRFTHNILLDRCMVKVDVTVHDIYWVLLIRLHDLAGIIHTGKLNVAKPAIQTLWRGTYIADPVSTL